MKLLIVLFYHNVETTDKIQEDENQRNPAASLGPAFKVQQIHSARSSNNQLSTDDISSRFQKWLNKRQQRDGKAFIVPV